MAKNQSQTQSQRFVDQTAKNAHETVTRLHESAAKVEDEIRRAAGTVVAGSPEGSTIDLANLEGAVRSVVDYVHENPFAAAAMALGAGVVLTSMYGDQMFGTRSRRMSSPAKKPRTRPKVQRAKPKARRRKREKPARKSAT